MSKLECFPTKFCFYSFGFSHVLYFEESLRHERTYILKASETWEESMRRMLKLDESFNFPKRRRSVEYDFCEHFKHAINFH